MTECDGNMYGLQCGEKCGFCSDGQQCHRVTGVCFTGCDSGFYGAKCDIGMFEER